MFEDVVCALMLTCFMHVHIINMFAVLEPFVKLSCIQGSHAKKVLTGKPLVVHALMFVFSECMTRLGVDGL